MPTLFADVTDSVALSDVLTLFNKPANAEVESTPGYSLIRNLIANGVRYNDIGANCSCGKRDLTVLLFGMTVYTNCQRHGLQEIGPLRRVITNGRVK